MVGRGVWVMILKYCRGKVVWGLIGDVCGVFFGVICDGYSGVGVRVRRYDGGVWLYMLCGDGWKWCVFVVV